MALATNAVDDLLRDREAKALEYTIGARFCFLLVATAVILANAESRLDVVFSLAFISTVVALLVWFLGCTRRRERLLLVGTSLVAIDAAALFAFPVIWYLAVGGEAVSRAYLVKNDQVAMIAVLMAVNALTLRAVYPALIAAVGVIQLVGFLVFASFDSRFFFTESNVETVLGSGVKPGFYVWRILATVLLGAVISGLAFRSRRIIQEAVESEVSRLRIQEEQTRSLTRAKLGAVGSLVAGIAHEINTPLGVINSSIATVDKAAEHLAESIDDARDLEQLRGERRVRGALAVFGEIRTAASSAGARISALVSSLEEFARLDRTQAAEADLNDCLDTTIALIDSELKGRVRIERRYAALPPVYCHVHAVNQVFLTVLTNGFEAMKGDGFLRLETVAEDDFVRVSISDTGCGIEPVQIAHLFDIGLGDKAGRVGLRVGLPTARRIIDDHGGELTVNSVPGRGNNLPDRAATRRQTWRLFPIFAALAISLSRTGDRRNNGYLRGSRRLARRAYREGGVGISRRESSSTSCSRTGSDVLGVKKL